MYDRDTDDLQQELMAAPDFDQFIEDNQSNFTQKNMAMSLNQLFLKKDITKSALAKRSNISEVYLHQVFAGTRNLSRNRLLCLCFGLSATLDETQELLKQCGFAQLYPRHKRDAVIIYGLSNSMDLNQVNDALFSKDEELLF